VCAECRHLVEQLDRDALVEQRGAELERRTNGQQARDERSFGPDPPEAQPAPRDLRHRADRDDLRTEGGHRQRRPASVDVELGGRLVRDEMRAGAASGRRDAIAIGIGHGGAGRVVEVGDQVGDQRAAAQQQLGEMADVPAVDADRRRCESVAVAVQGVERVREGRLLDHRALSAAADRGEHEVDGVQRP